MIRAGLIGLGKMGISHCSILGAHPQVELVAVCDSSALVLDGFCKYSSYKCYSNYKKMIASEDLDCVIIASPTRLHAEMVAFSLSRGLHVFCEKPFSLDYREGLDLARTARELGLVNQVGYHNRFIGTFNTAKQLIHGGVLGELYHFLAESYGPVVLKEKLGTWRSEKGQGGGCLYDYASHTIDLVHYVLSRPVSVSATNLKSIYSRDVEDAVYSTLTLKNGLTGQLSVNWSDETYRKMSTQLTVHGKLGKIIVDASEIKIHLGQENSRYNLPRGWTIRHVTDVTPGVNFFLRGEEYSAQLDHFIECILTNNQDTRSTFESAISTDEVINLMVHDAQIH